MLNLIKEPRPVHPYFALFSLIPLMSRILLGIICLFLLASCGFTHFAYLDVPSGERVKAKMAITTSEKVLGLSGIYELTDYKGMIFVEKEPKQAQFWMFDMEFPLDILFLDKDKKILEDHLDLQPCVLEKECEVIASALDNIKYVLEVPAGKAEEYGLTVNSVIDW
ncbi:DUF192 domain-containing protein [Candidatus Kuenenbacteria bacterium]|nr:DUF192 domain-containing protein [Candidatus Kuenenbacteria bacterium]